MPAKILFYMAQKFFGGNNWNFSIAVWNIPWTWEKKQKQKLKFEISSHSKEGQSNKRDASNLLLLSILLDKLQLSSCIKWPIDT